MATFAELLVTVRDQCVTSLTAAGRPAPTSVYVGEGEVAYDCCNALIVEPVQLIADAPDDSCPTLLADIRVHLLRCAAPMHGDDVPLSADIQTVGLGLAADAVALYQAATTLSACCTVRFGGITFPRSVGGECAPVVMALTATL